MSKSVCIAAGEYPPTIGGVGVSAHRIARHMAQLGYLMHVAVPDFQGLDNAATVSGVTVCTTVDEHRVTVHRIRVPLRTLRPKERDIETELYVALRELHRTYKFELFHCFYLRSPAFACALLAVEEGVPFVASARGSDLHKHVFAPGSLTTISWILRHASWSTYVSGSLRRRAIALAPEIESRTSTFWNSIDSSEFEDLPAVTNPATTTGITIGMLGRLRDKKGCETFIDACAIVAKRHNVSVVLMGGVAESQRDYWQHVLATSPISERIVALGPLDRRVALAYLQMLDIVVFSSIHDGCPNALLEAMASARPILASRVDALGEIIEPGRNGLLADPLSVKEFASMLDVLISDQDLRGRLGKAARADALSRFRPEVETEEWNKVYKSAMKVGGLPSR